MAKILSGKEVAAALNSRLQARAAALAEQGVLPTLAIVRVGEREDDLSYAVSYTHLTLPTNSRV